MNRPVEQLVDEILVMASSLLVSAVLVIILYIRKPAIDTIGMIESRYEWMQERLKAACDSTNEDNVVAAEEPGNFKIKGCGCRFIP